LYHKNGVERINGASNSVQYPFNVQRRGIKGAITGQALIPISSAGQLIFLLGGGVK